MNHVEATIQEVDGRQETARAWVDELVSLRAALVRMTRLPAVGQDNFTNQPESHRLLKSTVPVSNESPSLSERDGFDNDGNPMVWRKVLDDLRENGPSKNKQVRERLGMRQAAVAAAFCLLKKRGLAINDQSARWWAETDEIKSWPRSGGDANLLQVPIDTSTEYRDSEQSRETTCEADVSGAAKNSAKHSDSDTEVYISQPEIKSPEPATKDASFWQQVAERDETIPIVDAPAAFSAALKVLPAGRRRIAEQAACYTAGEFAALGRDAIAALPGCGDNTAEHLADWLRHCFGLEFAVIETESATDAAPQHLGDEDTLIFHFLAELPQGEREIVKLAKCRTPRELAAFGAERIRKLPNANHHTCNHVGRWLKKNFDLVLAE